MLLKSIRLRTIICSKIKKNTQTSKVQKLEMFSVQCSIASLND